MIGSPNFGERSVQRDLELQVAIVTEMIHTASLVRRCGRKWSTNETIIFFLKVHDDVLDHAETRRGKEAVNIR